MAKASSLVVTVLMPMLAAASSSSRMATQARPEPRILEPVQEDHVIAMITIIVMKYGTRVRGAEAVDAEQPVRLGCAMPVMPLCRW